MMLLPVGPGYGGNTMAEIGDVWQDTYPYPPNSKYGKNPPTLLVLKVEGGYVYGTRAPSMRKTKIKMRKDGTIPGYTLKHPMRTTAPPSSE